VRPAFTTAGVATGFALLLAVVLSLPEVIARAHLLTRRDVYPAIPVKYGPFPWIQQKIFDENKDVDIAFLGSSRIWCAIDTPYVKTALSTELGREAEVFTLGWPWQGFDALYVIARDLLDHRRVRTLVIDDEGRGDDLPHLHSSRWFLLAESSDALAGLPALAQLRLYGGAVLGTPRHLLSLLRSDLMEAPARAQPNFWNTYYRAPPIAERLGALRARLAFGASPDFRPLPAHTTARSEDAVIYSRAAGGGFQFQGPPTGDYQLHFARMLAKLCRDRGTRLVVLHTPARHELGQAKVEERENWAEILGAPVEIVGIPPARLFAGMSSDEVTALFYEDGHLNQNGQDLFTPLVTPALLELHASAANR